MEITFEKVSKQYKSKYALKNFTATLSGLPSPLAEKESVLALPVARSTQSSVPSAWVKVCGKNNLAASADPVKCVFNSSQFDGKIRECAYAGDGKLFVVADKLRPFSSNQAEW